MFPPFKTVLFITILCCSFSLAQNKRFFYERTFANDSLTPDVNKKELMVLDISNNGSKFYAYNILAEDSLKILKERRPGKFPYQGISNLEIIIKNYPSYEYNVYTGLLSINYKVVFSKNLEWKIEDETKELNGYKVQKATTTLYNRQWTAWYAPEIPIQDRPYLLHGLPGLILRAEDRLKSQIFELSGIKSLENFNAEYMPYYNGQKFVTIDDKKWTRLLKDFIEDPHATDRADNTPNHTYHLQDGTIVSKAEFIRLQEIRSKESRKKLNNTLRFEYLR